MVIEIKVPDVGADEVEITEILVKVGNKVGTEQSLITVEDDKTPTEAPSPQAGVVREVKVLVDDKTETGKLTMTLDSAEGVAVTAPAQEEEKEVIPAAAVPAATAVAEEVRVPDIGGDKVEVTEIMVKVDDTIAAEQSLITVEGDRASMKVPALFADTMREIKTNIGDKVSTGSLTMTFEVAGVAPTAAPAQVAAPAVVAPATVDGTKDANVPNIGGDEIEVTGMMVKVGDKMAAEQSLTTVRGDKAFMEVSAPFADTVKETKVSTGDKAKTGFPIIAFGVEGVAPAVAPAQAAASAPAAAPTQAAKSAVVPAAKAEDETEFAEDDAYVHATPLIRRLTREFDANLAKVKGTGRKGRILRGGVQAYVKDMVKRAEFVPAVTTGGGIPGMLPWPKVNFGKSGEIEEVELGRTQKISGANLSHNWVMIPHVTHFDKTGITNLETFRKQQNAEAEERKPDVKSTPAAFTMKTVAAALEQTPRFSSSLSEDDRCLTLKKYVNIGVAMDAPNGLVVPIFEGVNKKSIIELSHELTTILKKARDGRLAVGEMQGGCFIISNVGGLGTIHFVPIVNVPEVVILDMSKSTMEPVQNGKEFVPHLMMPISLSFDHRIIDGVDDARLITTINSTLNDIHRLMV